MEYLAIAHGRKRWHCCKRLRALYIQTLLLPVNVMFLFAPIFDVQITIENDFESVAINSWDSGCSLNAQWPRMLPLEKTRGIFLVQSFIYGVFQSKFTAPKHAGVGLFTESPSRLFPLTFTFTLHAGTLDIAFTLIKKANSNQWCLIVVINDLSRLALFDQALFRVIYVKFVWCRVGSYAYDNLP